MKDVQSFVIYPTFVETYRRMRKRDPDLALRFIDALFNYGYDGILPDEDDPIIDYMDSIFKQIDNAKNRYIKAKINGSKGGRPPVDIDELDIINAMDKYGTWKNVAAYLDIDEDTLRKYRKLYNIPDFKDEKP